MRKLRIAFLSSGTFTHIGPYLEFFAGQGHEVFLIAYDRPKRDYGVPVFDISRGANASNTLSKWKYLWAGISIRRILRDIRPDVLHGHYITSAGTICLMSGFKPYILTAHGSDLVGTHQSRLWRPILKTMFGRAALVNTVSGQLRDLVLGLGVSAEKIIVATLGVDTNFFQYQPPSPVHAPPRLLCTRTLNPVYDPLTIVRACELAWRNGHEFTLTFAAAGQLESQLQQYTWERNLQDRIHFMGGYDNRELPRLLREYDAFVSASLWDGTSICLLESMASGLVPIVSRIPSNLAWLEDGRTALMFDCGNADQLSSCIGRAISDESWRRTAAECNREKVSQRADRRKNMMLLEEAYYRMLDAPAVAR